MIHLAYDQSQASAHVTFLIFSPFIKYIITLESHIGKYLLRKVGPGTRQNESLTEDTGLEEKIKPIDIINPWFLAWA